MDRTDFYQLILECYDTRCRHDHEAMLACFHPRVTFRISGDPALIPFAGTYHGHEGVLRCVALIDERCQWLGFTLETLIVDGTCAAIRWSAPMRTPARREATVRCVDLVSVKDNLVFEFEEYFDTAMAVTLLGVADLDTRVLAGADPVRSGAAHAM